MDKKDNQNKPLSLDVQYGVGAVPFHTHNGIDSPLLGSSSSSANGSSSNGSQSIPGPSVQTKLSLSNSFVNGITWNSANHRFICTIAGIYFVTGIVNYSNVPTGKNYSSEIWLNGNAAVIAWVQTGEAGGPITATANTLFSLSVNDYIELYTEHNNSANENASSSALYIMKA